MAETMGSAQDERVSGSGRRVYRHALLVRLAHWTNVLCLAVLLMSGLQIFNAHPALYWGEDSDFARPSFSITTVFNEEEQPIGVTRIFGRNYETTGVLGWSEVYGRPAPRAFPAWITLPGGQDLATGRVWHFFFAWMFVLNGVIYLTYSIARGHLSRDLLPRLEELRRIGRVALDHLRFRFHQDRNASRYNVIQQLAYLSVVLLLLPVAVLSGLTMSPAIDAAAPWLLDLFGGRQSARSVHFIVASLLVLFVLVHVAMVLVSGFFNNMRGMITGWYDVASERRSRNDNA